MPFLLFWLRDLGPSSREGLVNSGGRPNSRLGEDIKDYTQQKGGRAINGDLPFMQQEAVGKGPILRPQYRALIRGKAIRDA